MIRYADFVQEQITHIAGNVGLPRLLLEPKIALTEAARLFPKRDGKPVSQISLWRWATKGLSVRGVRGGAAQADPLPPGTRIKLETIKVGATRYTSLEAIQRFAERLDPASAETSAYRPALRTPARRRAAARAAAKQLQAGGFM